METLNKTSLFWDVKEVDPQKNKRFVIERILTFGDIEDFKWAANFYSEKELKNAFLKSRGVDKKTANFWKLYFNISSKEWDKIQSARKPSAFWSK